MMVTFTKQIFTKMISDTWALKESGGTDCPKEFAILQLFLYHNKQIYHLNLIIKQFYTIHTLQTAKKQ